MGGWRCGYLRRSREGSDYTTINLYFVSHVFQSTLPRRERRYKRLRRVWDEVFQSTLPRRERHFRVTFPSESSSNFNPRSREGSDVEIAATVMHAVRFQSTLPRRERRIHDFRSHFYQNFNPRSREGSDPQHCTIRKRHLPFQSTLPRRERQCRMKQSGISITFQSTLPRRERRRTTQRRRTEMAISIHAPAKGATYTPQSSGVHGCYFNPRSREGSDADTSRTSNQRHRFQSTLPRRERPVSHRLQRVVGAISIHAPAKGATSAVLAAFLILLFQSTLPRRERLGFDPYLGATVMQFQSTLPRRERRYLPMAARREG